MKKKTWSFFLVAIFLFSFIPLITSTTVNTSVETEDDDPNATCFGRGRRRVVIIRDNYGVPHIFASNKEGLGYGCGYAVAQDRLWQADL